MSLTNPKKLYPTVLIVMALTLVAVTVIFAAMPMASTWHALVSAVVALAIAVPVAIAYTHRETGH